jgi:hypothetical protein
VFSLSEKIKNSPATVAIKAIVEKIPVRLKYTALLVTENGSFINPIIN